MNAVRGRVTSAGSIGLWPMQDSNPSSCEWTPYPNLMIPTIHHVPISLLSKLSFGVALVSFLQTSAVALVCGRPEQNRKNRTEHSSPSPPPAPSRSSNPNDVTSFHSNRNSPRPMAIEIRDPWGCLILRRIAQPPTPSCS